MPATSQFTPQQILDAARRAEGDHNATYALQFYRHLTDHHPNTPEAHVARDALNRLNTTAPAIGTALTKAVGAHLHDQTTFVPQPNHANLGGRVIPISPAPPHSHPVLKSSPSPLVPPHPIDSHPATGRPQRHTMPARHYKLGRALGALLGLCGGTGFIAAVTALIAPLLTAFGLSNTLPTFLPAISLSFGATLLTVSLILVLLSQMARAAFDAADAARHAVKFDE